MNQRGRRPRARSSPAAVGGPGRHGFTLVELLVVIVIISIILSFVLVAGMDAARRGEERATQTLITKLEGGLNDRLDALLQNRPDPNYAHAYMAAIWSSAAVTGNNLFGIIPPYNQIKQTQRAQVIAWYDYIKAELPDVFFLQSDPNGNYPINFAATPFGFPIVPSIPDPNLGSTLAPYAPYFLPLGNAIQNNPPNSFGDDNATNPNLGLTGSGIFGASYPIAAGIYKNLAVPPPLVAVDPRGYDGVDNNGNGLIDEISEWAPTLQQAQAIVTLLKTNHKHNTARSEMLYAILVEGRGPYGSVFSRDEFTDKEVQDTDGDGLPEFVDAWGQPLQFFRWPIFYHSDLQRGQTIVPDPAAPQTWDLVPPYQTVYQEREQDPLDVNRQLMAPAWWSQNGVGGQIAANNMSPFAPGPGAGSPVFASNGVSAFGSFFHLLTEPLSNPQTSGGLYWDRGGFPFRRAFYSKFLILSGGPDKVPGVFLYADADIQVLSSNVAGPVPVTAALIANENNAMPFALDLFGGGLFGFTNQVSIPPNGSGNVTTFSFAPSNDPTHPSSYDLLQGAQDDISNHNLQATGGIGGSG